jgi:hypothetical protein
MRRPQPRDANNLMAVGFSAIQRSAACSADDAVVLRGARTLFECASRRVARRKHHGPLRRTRRWSRKSDGESIHARCAARDSRRPQLRRRATVYIAARIANVDAWLEGSAEDVLRDAPGRLARDGWSALRAALSVTIWSAHSRLTVRSDADLHEQGLADDGLGPWLTREANGVCGGAAHKRRAPAPRWWRALGERPRGQARPNLRHATLRARGAGATSRVLQSRALAVRGAGRG